MSPVEQIKERLPIERLVSSYVKLERAGVNLKGRCPFHNEKTPSFFVSPDRGSFHCFGCNKGGDIFTFFQEIEHVEFKEALTDLAERTGVTLDNRSGEDRGEKAKIREVLARAASEYEGWLKENPEVKKYLLDRGVSEESIARHQIGYVPAGWSNLAAKLRGVFPESVLEKSGLFIRGEKGLYDRFRARIMFPLFDSSGHIVGFTGRLIKVEPGSTEGKYVNTPATVLYNKSRLLYGFDKAKSAIRENNECVLVEGQMDVIMSHQAGITTAVGVSGTALTADHMSAISRLTDKVVIILDADDAGFKASAKAVQMALASDLDVYVVGLPAGKDPADMAKEDPEVLKEKLKTAERFIPFALTFLSARSGGRELQKEIREFLYPYVRAMSNSVEQDLALQKIAEALGVPPSAVREDWNKNSSAPEVVFHKEVAKPLVQKVENSIDKILTRLRGVYLLLRGKETHADLVRLIEQEVERIIGSTLDNTADSALEFEAEAYYTGGDVSRAARELLRYLELERVKEELNQTLALIQKAEKEGSNDLPALLSKSQELSKRYTSLGSANV